MCSCAPPPPRPPLKLPTTILKECPGRRDLPLNVNLIGPIIVLSLAQRVAQFGKSGDLSCRKAEWKVADRWRRVRTSVRFVVLRPNWFSDNFHTFWREGIKQRVLAVLAGDGRSVSSTRATLRASQIPHRGGAKLARHQNCLRAPRH